MALSNKLLALVARIEPAAYDAIFPRGPIARYGPSPWPISGMDAGRAMATDYIRALWIADKSDGETRGLRDLDIWCPLTGNKFQLPPWFGEPVEPVPRPNWQQEFYLGFASQIAAALPKMAGSDLEGIANEALKHASGALEKLLG